jgi:hypothetical protein
MRRMLTYATYADVCDVRQHRMSADLYDVPPPRPLGFCFSYRLVRYKKKQSVLREKIPLYSYTGEPTLSDRGYELLKVHMHL